MSSQKIIEITTQAYTTSAIEAKGVEREKKSDISVNSTSPKESSTNNLNGSDIFNKK